MNKPSELTGRNKILCDYSRDNRSDDEFVDNVKRGTYMEPICGWILWKKFALEQRRINVIFTGCGPNGEFISDRSKVTKTQDLELILNGNSTLVEVKSVPNAFIATIKEDEFPSFERRPNNFWLGILADHGIEKKWKVGDIPRRETKLFLIPKKLLLTKWKKLATYRKSDGNFGGKAGYVLHREKWEFLGKVLPAFPTDAIYEEFCEELRFGRLHGSDWCGG